MSKPENPFAFPIHRDDPDMTLRDYFAGQALPGVMAHVSNDEVYLAEDVAQIAYQIVDAMLAERAKSGGQQ